MAYPGAKVHRRSRRKLGRGQTPSQAPISTALATTTSLVTITFSDAVNVRGPISLTFSPPGPTTTTQTVVSPTVVTIAVSGGSTQLVIVPNNPTNVVGQRGQPITGSASPL